LTVYDTSSDPSDGDIDDSDVVIIDGESTSILKQILALLQKLVGFLTGNK